MKTPPPPAIPSLSPRPRWRRWLVGAMPWLLFLGAVALMSPLRS